MFVTAVLSSEIICIIPPPSGFNSRAAQIAEFVLAVPCCPVQLNSMLCYGSISAKLAYFASRPLHVAECPNHQTNAGKLQGATSISASIDGGAVTTSPIMGGATKWQLTLPATAGNLEPHTIKVTAAGGGSTFSATLVDVLFGESVLCSGQSNMCFSTNQMTGAHDEIELAGAPRFRNVRLFTVAPTCVFTLKPRLLLRSACSVMFYQSRW